MTIAQRFTSGEAEEAAGDLALILGLTRADVMNYAVASAPTRDSHDLAVQVGRLSNMVDADPDKFGLSRRALASVEVMLSKHDAADRRRLAERGWALSDGSYPIEDEQDAKNAAELIRAHRGDYVAAAKLLAKRCAEEGWRNPLDSDDDEVAAMLTSWEDSPVGLTAGSTEAALLAHVAEDLYDPYRAEVVRLCMVHGKEIGLASPADSPEQFGLSAGGSPVALGHGMGDSDMIAARHPGMFGGSRTKPAGTTRPHRPGRGHVRTCPKDCTRDHNQPRRGNAMHPEAERLILKHQDLGMFGKPDPDRTAGNRTIRPGELPPGARRY